MQESKPKEFQIRRNIIRPRIMRQVNIFEQNKHDLKRKQLITNVKPRNQNIFKQVQTEKEVLISEDVIKNSRLYKLLEQQIDMSIKQHEQQMAKLQEADLKKTKDTEKINKKSHSLKIQIWELKNQIMDLQNQINYQEDQFRYMASANTEQQPHEQNQQDDQINQGQPDNDEQQYQEQEMQQIEQGSVNNQQEYHPNDK